MRHEAAEESRQVALHVRIGILLDQQRAGRVPDEEGQKPGVDAGLPYEGGGAIGEFVETGPTRLEAQDRLCRRFTGSPAQEPRPSRSPPSTASTLSPIVAAAASTP